MTHDDPLLAAYERTRYCADTTHGQIVIRVGQPCSTLDLLLRETGCVTWAYITAFNPGSVPFRSRQNKSRQRELEKVVRQLGHLPFSGEGIADDGAWPPEQSILVLGIGREVAVGLGRQFGQRAIVFGEITGPAELVLCE